MPTVRRANGGGVLMMCEYQWEVEYEPDDEDHTEEDDHQCILEEGHSGEHECRCGDTQEEL